MKKVKQMSTQDLLRLTTNIKNISKIGKVDWKTSSPSRFFGLGENSIYVKGKEDMILYQNYMEQIHSYQLFFNDYTFKKIENDVMNLIKKAMLEGRDISEKNIKDFVDKLNSKKTIEFQVYIELFGLIIDENINLGEFRIIKSDSLEEKIDMSKDNGGSLYQFLSFSAERTKILLSACTRAKQQDRACELTYKKFDLFINTIALFVGALKDYQINTSFGNHSDTPIMILVGAGSNFGSSMFRYGGFRDINLTKMQLEKEKYCKLWELITKKCDIAMEIRLQNAIQWAGKAFRSNDYTSSYLYFVIAIECMLGEKNSNSSILNQIKEPIAFMLYNNLEDRLQFLNTLNKIYNIRSEITHAGATIDDITDLQEIRDLTSNMIHKFLTEKPYSEFKTLAELQNHIKKLKYSTDFKILE